MNTQNNGVKKCSAVIGGGRERLFKVLLAYLIVCRLVLSLNAPANAMAPGSPMFLLPRLHGVVSTD